MMELLTQLRLASPWLFWSIGLMLLAFPPLAVGSAMDSHTILGLNRWIKPMKFILSTVTYSGTLLWLLKDAATPGFSSVAAAMVAAVMLGENILIILQSWRGVPSHFNNGTPFDGLVFGVMGLMILLNTLVVAAFLVQTFSGPALSLSAGYRWGIRLGTLLFLLGSLQAGLMLRIQAHTVGAADGGPGLPFLNWSVRHGDLRVAHFLGLHALQVLPLAGFLVDRAGVPNPALAVCLVAALWLGLFLLTVLQALSGKPLLY